jgi:Cu/Ag efflux protein CusF
MRKFAVPALAALFVLNAGLAMAWSNVTGVIKSIDASTHEFTLDDGKTYAVEGNINLGTFKTGDKVTVTTQPENGKNMVNKVIKSS